MNLPVLRTLAKAVFGTAIALHLAASPLGYVGRAHAAPTSSLPAPYVSRALDAVLIPIDAGVRKEFELGPKQRGVLVLAVQPDGVAARSGIEAGDVIAEVKGKKIKEPIELETVVYYWINHNQSDFVFGTFRAGQVSIARATVDLAHYSAAIDLSTVASWTAVTSFAAFSYSEFYSEYSEEITTSYEESETRIEETASSDDYAEGASSDEAAAEQDTDGDGIDNAEDTDDDGDGIADVDDTDDDGDGVEDADDGEGDDADSGADADDADDSGDNDGGDADDGDDA